MKDCCLTTHTYTHIYILVDNDKYLMINFRINVLKNLFKDCVFAFTFKTTETISYRISLRR